MATGFLRRCCQQLQGRPHPAGMRHGQDDTYCTTAASIRNDLLARTCALCVLFLSKTLYTKIEVLWLWQTLSMLIAQRRHVTPGITVVRQVPLNACDLIYCIRGLWLCVIIAHFHNIRNVHVFCIRHEAHMNRRNRETER